MLEYLYQPSSSELTRPTSIKKIVDTNEALKKYNDCHGMDFMNHGNIALRHLDSDKLHLKSNGVRFLAKNLVRHSDDGNLMLVVMST